MLSIFEAVNGKSEVITVENSQNSLLNWNSAFIYNEDDRDDQEVRF